MKSLFDPIRIGNMELKNRFVKAATYEGKAAPDGHLTDELRKLYLRWAEGGPGMIITSYAYVLPKGGQPNPRMLGICDDSFIPEYRELTEAVHLLGRRIVLQIVYGGSNTFWQKEGPIWGPSAVPNPRTGVIPQEMTPADMKTLAEAFAAAALRAKEAGFDGVELHAAHGYLLSMFLSPELNRRTDEYGGSIENRARLLREILTAMRESAGRDYPILMKLNSTDGTENGLSEEDSLSAAKLLAPQLDAIEVSGPFRSFRVSGRNGSHSFFAPYAAKLAEEVTIPVILTGGNRDFSEMQELLNSTGIEAFGLGRPLISQPDLVLLWKKDPGKKPRCISCDLCFSRPDCSCNLDRPNVKRK